jgi:REP element-mobilizing transposase RayT
MSEQQQQPLVIVYHIYWTVYGAWLPNDLRGSMSEHVRAPWIGELGEAHYGRKRDQPTSREIREFMQKAREALKYPTFEFRPEQFALVADAMREVIERERYTCYAWVVMPDHVHGLIRKHKHKAEEMIANFQHHSRLRLSAALNLPEGHPVWTRGGHAIYLDRPDEVRRTIKYIKDNPLKNHLPRQSYDFVIPYDGWPLHPGHSPNPPYARRLRGG